MELKDLPAYRADFCNTENLLEKKGNFRLIEGDRESEIPHLLRVKQEGYLRLRSDLSYNRAADTLWEMGGSPGCHWPVLIVVADLFVAGKIHNVLEFGSGMSSLFFSALAKKYNGKQVTLENHRKWFEMNIEFFKRMGVPSQGLFHKEEFWEPGDLIDNGPFDFVFSDCEPALFRRNAVEKYLPALTEDCVIFFDDCEQDQFFFQHHDWAEQLGLTAPGRFYSEQRGIAVIDPSHKLDSINFETTPEYK